MGSGSGDRQRSTPHCIPRIPCTVLRNVLSLPPTSAPTPPTPRSLLCPPPPPPPPPTTPPTHPSAVEPQPRALACESAQERRRAPVLRGLEGGNDEVLRWAGGWVDEWVSE